MKKTARRYVEVAPAVPLSGANQAYTYHLTASQDSVALGTRVTVPFGPRQVTGIVSRVFPATHRVPYRTKAVKEVTGPELSAEQIALAEWIAKVYRGGLGYTLRLFFPPARLPVQSKAESPALAPHAPRKSIQAVLRATTNTHFAYIEHRRENRYKAIADLASAYAARQQQVMILVPEKWMVETVAQAITSLPVHMVGQYHSDRKASERAAIWQGVAQGSIAVVVGTQAALFLPYRTLGAVVLEEEQLATHKLWDQYPRLHNRDAVQALSRIHAVPLLYTASGPSLFLQHGIEEKHITVLLHEPRATPLTVLSPSFTDRNQRQVIPVEAQQLLRKAHRAQERVFIFYNRRGSWKIAVCKSCKEVWRCPQCAVAITIHQTKGKPRGVCHHCDFNELAPKKCPACHKSGLSFRGMGAEKIESIISKEVQAPVTRLDADSVAEITEVEKEYIATSAPLVIGTLAAFTIIDGKTFDRVVWLFPENTLYYPDFRSVERSYTLAHRLQTVLPPRRRLVVVTRHPHFITQTLGQSPARFSKTQLAERKRLHYPPFTTMVQLTVTAATDEEAHAKALAARRYLQKQIKDHSSHAILRGPYRRFVSRKGRQRAEHLLLLGDTAELVVLYQKAPVDFVDVTPEQVL